MLRSNRGRRRIGVPTQWAKRGLSHISVQRIWAAHGVTPHLTKTFKLSNAKRFVKKVQDIVGLYLVPPEKTMVLSVDEKSQIQALDRTQPGLPMKKGPARTSYALSTASRRRCSICI